MKTASLTLIAFAELVESMRLAQQAYFKARRSRSVTDDERQQLLIASKALEAEVDAAIRRTLQQPRKHEPLPGQTNFLDTFA